MKHVNQKNGSRTLRLFKRCVSWIGYQWDCVGLGVFILMLHAGMWRNLPEVCQKYGWVFECFNTLGGEWAVTVGEKTVIHKKRKTATIRVFLKKVT